MKRFARALVAVFGFVVLGSFVLLAPQKNATGAGAAVCMRWSTRGEIALTSLGIQDSISSEKRHS